MHIDAPVKTVEKLRNSKNQVTRKIEVEEVIKTGGAIWKSWNDRFESLGAFSYSIPWSYLAQPWPQENWLFISCSNCPLDSGIPDTQEGQVGVLKNRCLASKILTARETSQAGAWRFEETKSSQRDAYIDSDICPDERVAMKLDSHDSS